MSEFGQLLLKDKDTTATKVHHRSGIRRIKHQMNLTAHL